MLHTKTVEPNTLELLKKLMQIGALNSFFLVGGTALSLQLGHRTSIDLDLFTSEEVDLKSLISYLPEHRLIAENPFMLQMEIEGIKVDVVKLKVPLVEPLICFEGVRMMGPKDIAAMKLKAIAGRGSKKDFYDLYVLLKQFSLEEMVGFFTIKFPSQEKFSVFKSLSYFEDAEEQPDPVLFMDTNWDAVKGSITKEVNDYVRNL